MPKTDTNDATFSLYQSELPDYQNQIPPNHLKNATFLLDSENHPKMDILEQCD